MSENPNSTIADADIAEVVAKYRRLAPFYDWIHRLPRSRREAVSRLNLRDGDVVIDAGCGTGLSFACIRNEVGEEGTIVGIDASPHMLARAQQRVQRRGWQNVLLIEGPAQDVVIPREADAVLFYLAPGITDSIDALTNILSYCRRGAKVSAVGPKWFPNYLLPANALVWLVSKPFVTSFKEFSTPWSNLRDLSPDLQVKPMWLGSGYLAWGTVKPPEQREGSSLVSR